MKMVQHSDEEEQLLKRLREIILRDDRAELNHLQDLINDPKQLATKVSPIITEHIEFLKQNFPTEFEQAVDKIVEQKIISSQDQIVNLIYPKLDIMIKKYVTSMFQKLKDSIDERLDDVKSTFSFGGIKARFASMFTGVKQSDVILTDIGAVVIEEIFIIQQESGLLVAVASKSKHADQDVIAGMLTAIKSFVEDAFDKGSEDLEMIRYENSKIFLQNFQSYYFAVSLTGSLSEVEKEKLSEELITFAKEDLPFNIKDITATLFEETSKKLDRRFFAENHTMENQKIES